jgi:oligopeptide/dipeptide ABC transporter ATP-binding protein
LNLTYLFVSHDLSVIEKISDRIAVMYLGRIVEMGPKSTVFSNPKHPYTRALLSAIPKIDQPTKKQRIILKGDIPNPGHPPAGCHFHQRCPHVMEQCRAAYPAQTHHEGRKVACWLF